MRDALVRRGLYFILLFTLDSERGEKGALGTVWRRHVASRVLNREFKREVDRDPLRVT